MWHASCEKGVQAKAEWPGDGKSEKGRDDENAIEKASLDRPGGVDSDGSASRECPGLKQNAHERCAPKDQNVERGPDEPNRSEHGSGYDDPDYPEHGLPSNESDRPEPRPEHHVRNSQTNFGRIREGPTKISDRNFQGLGEQPAATRHHQD